MKMSNNFDKEIVKMDKQNAVVVGLKINGGKIFTEYFEELIEEMCYHALAKEWLRGEIPDPAETFKFIEKELSSVLLGTTNKLAHRKMFEIITKDPQEIKREIFKRCLGEDAPVDDDEPETADKEESDAKK